jgi:phosphatidylinositol-3,4,5-trisphosphate 3-phosphatase and dual-specificity protein phosphatase PTEN
LLLECCVDIAMFMIKNPDSVVAIHCKAGKGRTGTIVCCYLIFSGICKTTEEAMEYYSIKRTMNKKVI